MMNLEESNFLFSANNVNSTYFYHTKNNEIQFLHIDVSLKEDKVMVLHEKLTNDELE